MVWARFDDHYLESPKVEAAGPLAEHLDMRAIIYAARNETDGLITPTALLKIGLGLPRMKARVDALVLAGRWHPNLGGGWLIHDFLDYNPSKAALSDKRSKDKERQRSHRESRSDTSRDSNVNHAWPRSGRESVDQKKQRELAETDDQADRDASEPPWRRAGVSRADWLKREPFEDSA